MLPIPTRTIASTQLAAGATTVQLTVDTSGLPFTARHLVIRVNARSDRAVAVTSVAINFNSDTTDANYHRQRLLGIGSSASANRASDDQWGTAPGASATANNFGGGEWLIPDAFSTRTHKSMVGLSGAGEEAVRLDAGRWANTDAITTVEIIEPTGNEWITLSTFELAVVDEMFAIPGAETILT